MLCDVVFVGNISIRTGIWFDVQVQSSVHSTTLTSLATYKQKQNCYGGWRLVTPSQQLMLRHVMFIGSYSIRHLLLHSGAKLDSLHYLDKFGHTQADTELLWGFTTCRAVPQADAVLCRIHWQLQHQD